MKTLITRIMQTNNEETLDMDNSTSNSNPVHDESIQGCKTRQNSSVFNFGSEKQITVC